MYRSTTVVIPVFNQARYLFRAISSAYWQLGPDDQIIVVDDASTDFAECAGIEQFMDRVILQRNETNRGASHSRNRAILEAKTEWIKFLDADDILAPFTLNAILEEPELPDRVKVLTGSSHRFVDSRYHDLVPPIANIKQIRYVNPLLLSATFVRRQALIDAGMFDERIDFEEDWDLSLKLYEKFGPEAFVTTAQPFCFYWIEHGDRQIADGRRKATVDGQPVRQYLQTRYGITPID